MTSSSRRATNSVLNLRTNGFCTLPTPDGTGSLSLETVSIGIAKGTPAEQLGSWFLSDGC